MLLANGSGGMRIGVLMSYFVSAFACFCRASVFFMTLLGCVGSDGFELGSTGMRESNINELAIASYTRLRLLRRYASTIMTG